MAATKDMFGEKSTLCQELITDIILMSIIRWLQNTEEIPPKQFLTCEKTAVEGIATLLKKHDEEISSCS